MYQTWIGVSLCVQKEYSSYQNQYTSTTYLTNVVQYPHHLNNNYHPHTTPLSYVIFSYPCVLYLTFIRFTHSSIYQTIQFLQHLYLFNTPTPLLSSILIYLLLLQPILSPVSLFYTLSDSFVYIYVYYCYFIHFST